MSFSFEIVSDSISGVGGGGELLRISSDGEVQRILFGFEIHDFVIFLGKKILANFFGGSL